MKYRLSFKLILGIIMLQKCFSDFGGLTYGLKKIPSLTVEKEKSARKPLFKV